MIHIVFQEADLGVLQKSIELDASMQGEILLIRDDYAVGPISGIYTEEGRSRRIEWWKEVLKVEEGKEISEDELSQDSNTVGMLITRLKEDPSEIVWIWAAQNKHDVSGYYWLISQLKDFQGRIFILYLNNLPFINEKGNIFYPDNLFEIPPREFLKARKLARVVTLSEFEIDPDEWNRLGQEDKGVRLLEGGKKLVQADYDYYDADLKKYITKDWQKGSRIINQFLSKNKQTTGDAYLLWRLKGIISSGGYDVQGELRGMKDFEVKLQNVPESATQAEHAG